MGAVLAWSDPFQLVTPLGTLDLNAPIEGVGTFTIIPQASSCGNDLRVPKRSIPGGDGSIFQRRFKNGYPMTLALLMQPPGSSEADYFSGRQSMYDLLVSYLDALVDGEGRVNWIPAISGADRRMLTECALFMPPTPGGWDNDGIVKTATFGIESPFPYAISYTQESTVIADGDSATLTMEGTVYRGVHPVIQVDEATEVTITNETTGKVIEWDSSRPGCTAIGSGEYGEIDCFRGTMYLNGDSTNLEAGFDLTVTNFITLVPGDNTISVDGADVTILWNHGYA